MLFNSLEFAIFFPIVFALYWLLPHKFRWILLFISSYWFYMCWEPKYVILILLTTLTSFFAALGIDRQTDARKRKSIMITSSVICLSVLFFFKYYNFVSGSVTAVLRLFVPQVKSYALDLLLPVGISFYTFQTMSYVIDVYKGKVTAERHFGIYATFISFFPQLVAGPIERTDNLLPQIKSKKSFDYTRSTYGLKLMTWGFFKKIVVADTISKFISPVFESPQSFHGFALVLATGLFAFQIYCDFSGYSDIAIGVSRLLGIDLMTNFKSPYFSQSIREFWSRWHISLSTWFRDYLYIPLGGNRVRPLRNAFNLLVTFLISGLWHGANWTFVIWGGLHGVAQILENRLHLNKPRRIGSLSWSFRVVGVFCFCSFAWIFFAAQSMTDAVYIIRHMFDGITGGFVSYLYSGFVSIGLDRISLAYLLISVLILLIFDRLSLQKDVIESLSKKHTVSRWIIYVLFMLWTILNLPAVVATEFIYFQF